MKVLPRSFYNRDTRIVAKELLGKYIIRNIGRKRSIGKIVETEAYLENDPASHAYKGITPRCAPMFEHPGYAYIYFIYGNHYCLNVVTEKFGRAGAVLIRALEPISNVKLMTNGPGKLTKALRINMRSNRADLTSGNLLIAKGKTERFKVVKAKRIGLSKASEKQYRYFIQNNPFVSKYQ